MPRRTHRPALPEWQRDRPFQSQQDQIQFLAQPGPAAPSAQSSGLPLHILSRLRPFLSDQRRLRPPIAVPSAADIAALDSNIQAVAQLRIQRRTDIGYVRVIHKPRTQPPPEPLPEVDVATIETELKMRIRDLRLEALWLGGALEDDEYFALRQAA